MYSLGIAYLLWFLSGFGMLGFHRFYLGKIPTGILWMFSFGGFLVGSIYDFFTLPTQVKEANMMKALFDHTLYHQSIGGGDKNWRYAEDAQARVVKTGAGEKEPIERVILKIAKENKGILTVSEVALGGNITIEEAKKYLETLVSKGFADLRVRKSGSLVYVIPDLLDNDEPLEDF